MDRYRVLRKAVALAVILVFLFQVDVLLYPQRGDDIEEQFRKIKESYLKDQDLGARKRIERLMVFIDEKKLGMQKILGMCHLLLGAIYERKGELELAKENYRKAKEDYDTRKVEGVDLDSLEWYRKIVKGERPPTDDRVIVEEGKKKKKKFPWLLVAGGVVIVAVVAILLSKKKKKEQKTYTLSVTKGEGVTGSPDTGTYTYSEGEWIDYNYEAESDYTNLEVKLDGQIVGASSRFEMYKDHRLEVTADKINEVRFEVSPDNVGLVEGKSTTFLVRLNLKPETEVIAKVRTVEPNSLITVISGEELTFYPHNWDIFQTVEIRAENDGNVEDDVETVDIYDPNGIIPVESLNVTIYDTGNPYQGPEIEITNPSDGEKVAGDVNISVSVEDTAYTIEEVEFFIDGASVHSDESSPYSYQWDTRDAVNGPHTIRVVVSNNNDNKAEDSVTVEVINDDPPTVQIISPQDGATVSGVITVKVEAQDDVGIARVELLVNGDRVQTLNASPYYFELDTNALNNGTNFIRVDAYDTAGQSGFQEIEITVDNRE